MGLHGVNSSKDSSPEDPEYGSDEPQFMAGSPDEIVAEIFADFSGKLERIAWSILRDWQLAADAVQETFVLFNRKLVEIAPDQRRGWLVKTVQFQAYNIRRKHQRIETGMDDRILSDAIAGQVVPEERAEFLDDIHKLNTVILSLPTQQQLVVNMRLRDDKSFREIAQELGIPLGTVLSRMRLALEKIRARMHHE